VLWQELQEMLNGIDTDSGPIVKGKIYPALAQHQGQNHTPRVGESLNNTGRVLFHLRLQEYCDHHAVESTL
jgi:hypothetical protein